MRADLADIATKFELAAPVAAIESLGEGFINDTFIVRTVGEATDYILQRKNKRVFPDVPSMMENIRKVTEHIRHRVSEVGGDPEREAMRVIPTLEGALYDQDAEGEYWTVVRLIEDTITYSRADTPALARKGGEGIGRFQSQLADFTEPLAETIKGFHNIRHRFAQWDEALTRNTAQRTAQLTTEIGWIEARRTEMLHFWELVEQGIIPTRVTHNDTKISNILFDKSGEVLCAIDLDTVMNSPSHNDFGDAIRSYTNTGDEDDADLQRVGMSLEMFSAYAEGYLSQRVNELTTTEIDNLAFSARYITCEQVLRFLMDYIDGDTYYKIKYANHNLVRTRAQYKLLCSMEEQYGTMCAAIQKIAEQYRNR
ncbi:MAG: aminoglycoside phosphotransferase family protein [Alistipes sp.]